MHSLNKMVRLDAFLSCIVINDTKDQKNAYKSILKLKERQTLKVTTTFNYRKFVIYIPY